MEIHSKRWAGLAVSATILAASATPALAQRDAVADLSRPQLVERLFECREIADPEQRLACFDREVGALQTAEESNEVVIADREQVREAKRGLFGFSIPKIPLFSKGEEDGQDEVSELASTIQQAAKMGNGRWIFVIDGGARWMQTDSTPILGEPGRGDSIVIERASLGSFKAKIEGGRAFRIRRVE